MSNIKAGYRLEICSWENDADHYRTQVLEGLTEEQARFYIEFAKRFTSDGSHRKGGDKKLTQLGNEFHDPSLLFEVYTEVAEKHNFVVDPQEWEIMDEESIYEWLTDCVLGNPVDDYYCEELYFCRVFDSAKVVYVPTELEDVTCRFM